MNPIELGKFIAQLRSDKELTQEELAEKLYIDKRKISRWECGTSIPEFDMLIKLSEIFDVSLYEFSICKKITDEKISQRMINKFKNIKDLNNYKNKRTIFYILLILLLCFFISTTIYAFKNNNTVEVYELESLDENYHIKGNYVKLNGHYSIIIIEMYYGNSNELFNFNECNYEIYNQNTRISSIVNSPNTQNTNILPHYEKFLTSKTNTEKSTIKIYCDNENKEQSDYSFNFKLNKIYDNSFF